MAKQIADYEVWFYINLNSHKHIIRTIGCVENEPNLTVLVQEFARDGDLGNLLLDNVFRPSEKVLIEIFLQIADGMAYIARNHVVHGDLGCRNILVFEKDPDEPKKNKVKITDFGLARRLDSSDDDYNTTIIPIRFCAPEILQNNIQSNYSEKSDVYSMGVLMWEALSYGMMPYASIAKENDVVDEKLNNRRLTKPSACNSKLWNIIEDCWHMNPKQRCTFEKIKNQLSNIEADYPHIGDIQLVAPSFR
ncbi:unnamed protein product [Rotaria sp. Silwood2]|nr:unnamed protein product [Rotaria sp. Silwood2]